MVETIDKKLRDVVSAGELKKLTIETARPEFKKVL